MKQQFSQSAPVKASASVAAAASKQATEYKGKATAEEERESDHEVVLPLALLPGRRLSWSRSGGLTLLISGHLLHPHCAGDEGPDKGGAGGQAGEG